MSEGVTALRVLFYSVLNLSHAGGVEIWLSEVCTRLTVEVDIDVSVITTQEGDIRNPEIKQKIISHGIELIEIPVVKVGSLILPKVEGVIALWRGIKKCDVVYFNNAFALHEVLIAVLARLAGKKVISAYQGLFPGYGGFLRQSYHRIINRWVSKCFDAHHVVNTATFDLLIRMNYKNIYLIPNGVDAHYFKPGQKGGLFTVLFVGSLSYQKGFDLFVECVSKLCRECQSTVKVVIIGRGTYEINALELANTYKNVTYITYASRDRLRDEYAKAHVLVVPSRFEEFPLAPLEAQASGTPVLGSDIPGMQMILYGGEARLKVSLDPDIMVRKIVQLKRVWEDDFDTYNKLALRARLNAEQYSWPSVIQQLKDMFHKVVSVK